MTHRLLLVEPSATMRFVLEKHLHALTYTVDVFESYEDAQQALHKQYQQYGNEYKAVVMGWPSLPEAEAEVLASLLEQPDYEDLPVVVMSTDMRAETRAWVAGRASTAVVAWKDYKGVEPVLNQLLETDTKDTSGPAKFDNTDIHLLVVDDSATIRHSLRDLFRMQGYQVTLAATQEEALNAATSREFDIAILDFYLGETTGDVLCRELINHNGTGDIVCTVLTGTYSDHIIKRSLRSGAVECMFKNESSELLLSRIDAISRFVRQQRALKSERIMMEQVIEKLVGGVVIVEADGIVSYVSGAAVLELELDNVQQLLGAPANIVFTPSELAASGTGLHSAKWKLPKGGTLAVDYEHVLVEESGRSVVRFARKELSVVPDVKPVRKRANVEQLSQPDVLAKFELKEGSALLLSEMQEYLKTSQSLDDRVSFLVLDVFLKTHNGRSLPVSAHAPLQSIVTIALSAIYRRAGHVAVLKDNRYAFLLRHKEESQSYLLVRKIMQMCLEIEHGFKGVELACSGSLLSISRNSEQPLSVLLDHAFKGVDLVNTRAPNQALLLDLRRMLSAYPVQESVASKQG